MRRVLATSSAVAICTACGSLPDQEHVAHMHSASWNKMREELNLLGLARTGSVVDFLFDNPPVSISDQVLQAVVDRATQDTIDGKGAAARALLLAGLVTAEGLEVKDVPQDSDSYDEEEEWLGC